MAGTINRQFNTRVNERTSCLYQGTLKDEAGALITVSRITALTMTLYVLDSTQAVINAVSAVNIFNVGRGVVDEFGVLKIQLTALDNVITVAGRSVERHAMLIRATYDTDDKQGSRVVSFPVYDVDKVP